MTAVSDFFIPPKELMPSFKVDRSTSVLAGPKSKSAQLMYNALSYLTVPERIITENCISKNVSHTFVMIEMVRRMPKKDREAMAARLEKIRSKTGFESGVDFTATRLNSTVWEPTDSPFNHSDLDLYAWLAFTDNKIARTTVSTTFLFQSVFATKENPYVRAGSAKVVRCFYDNGDIFEPAQKIIEATFINKLSPLLNEQQRQTFWEVLKQQPVSEQQFLTVDGRSQFPKCIIGKFEANDLVHIPILTCRSEKIEKRELHVTFDNNNNRQSNVTKKTINVYTQIVPSFGMQLSALTALFGKNAVRMNLVFGISTGRDLKRNPFFRIMDCAIANRWYKNPNVADTHPALEWQYTLHDFYHCLISSGIPANMAILMIRIVLFLEASENKNSNKKTDKKAESTKKEANDKIAKIPQKPEFEFLRRMIVDMELSAFRPDYRNNNSDDFLFWKSLVICIVEFGKNVTNEYAIKHNLFLPNTTQYRDTAAVDKYEAQLKIETSKPIKLILDFIFSNKLDEESGISIQGLEQFRKTYSENEQSNLNDIKKTTEEKEKNLAEKKLLSAELSKILDKQKNLEKEKHAILNLPVRTGIEITKREQRNKENERQNRIVAAQLNEANKQIADITKQIDDLDAKLNTFNNNKLTYQTNIVVLNLMAEYAKTKTTVTTVTVMS